VNDLHPWANGPFELLVHAETHLLGGEDFDRRIALISFDDAIEVAITTYLTLHPIQRDGRNYERADVTKWLHNYHTKLDFLEAELAARDAKWTVEKSYIVWVHDHRNEQYHGGQKGTPEKNVLKIIREAALWVFCFLFDVADVEALLAKAIADNLPPSTPERDEALDKAIDRRYPMIDVGEQSYYASELLYATDYAAYRDLGARLRNLTTRNNDQETDT